MEERPRDLDEQLVVGALQEWGIKAEAADYAAVGFGDHHWHVEAAGGDRWFVTVADLEHKEHCGATAADAFAGLTKAMDTAAELRARRGLGFVVAPMRTSDGATVVALDRRYALSVFPYSPGRTGEFGQEQSPEERDRILAVLARLHQSTPPDSVPMTDLDPPGRPRLEEALSASADLTELGAPEAPRQGAVPGGEHTPPPDTGHGEGPRQRASGAPDGAGPFAGAARRLVTDHASALRTRLEEFDRLAAAVRRRGAPLVVTHGEPHPANRVDGPDGLRLVDWDTVGLALPERDLSLVTDDPADLAHYAATTGRIPDSAALALYPLRWDLADAAEFIAWFSGPHGRTADTDHAWDGFTDVITRLCTGPARTPG